MFAADFIEITKGWTKHFEDHVVESVFVAVFVDFRETEAGWVSGGVLLLGLTYLRSLASLRSWGVLLF